MRRTSEAKKANEPYRYRDTSSEPDEASRRSPQTDAPFTLFVHPLRHKQLKNGVGMAASIDIRRAGTYAILVW